MFSLLEFEIFRGLNIIILEDLFLFLNINCKTPELLNLLYLLALNLNVFLFYHTSLGTPHA